MLIRRTSIFQDDFQFEVNKMQSLTNHITTLKVAVLIQLKGSRVINLCQVPLYPMQRLNLELFGAIYMFIPQNRVHFHTPRLTGRKGGQALS